jgi:hypothetical protein
MDRKSNIVGDHKVRPLARIIAATLCLILILMSLALVNATSFAATAHHANKQSSALPSDTSTITPTDTTTPSPTSTLTPSPTNTITPSPSPTPTKTPTPKPTATPTSAPGATPTATTPKPTSTAQPGTTPTSSDNSQTPTPISGVPNSTTNNGNNGGNNNTPTTPTGGGFSQSLGTISMGLLTLLGFVSALFVGLQLLRKHLLPSPVPQASLPPSGAQPWRRVRTESLNGITNVPGGQNDWNIWPTNTARAGETPEIRALPQGSAPTMAPNMGYNITNNNTFQSPSAGSFPGGTTPPFSPSPNTADFPNTTTFSSPNNGNSPNYNNAFPTNSSSPNSAPNAADPQSRPFQAPSNNNEISPLSTVEQPPITADVLSPQATKTASSLHPVPAGITHADRITENVKPHARLVTKPIRLQNMRNAAPPPVTQNSAPQNRKSEPISEELPSFDDLILQDTLKQYIQRGEIALQQPQNGEP